MSYVGDHDFIQAFTACSSVTETAEKLGMTKAAVFCRAARLRKLGIYLPFHKKWKGQEHRLTYHLKFPNTGISTPSEARSGPSGVDIITKLLQPKGNHMEVKTGLKEIDEAFNLVISRLDQLEDRINKRKIRAIVPVKNMDGTDSAQMSQAGAIQRGVSLRREAMVRRFCKERRNVDFRVQVLYDYLLTHAPTDTPAAGAVTLWLRARPDIFQHLRRGWYRYTGPME